MNLETIWEESFNEAIADIETRTGTNPTDWRVGGRATVKNPDKENKAWWDENGLKMFQEFVAVWHESHIKIWESPEGLPGIELGFNQYFGNVLIKGFADLVGVLPSGELIVVDFKTGSRTPDSAMQLGLYACLMELQFGVRPTRGYFYSARSAKFEEVEGLHRWTVPVFTVLCAQFARGLEAEIFLPIVGMSCGTCGVKDYCYAVGGDLSKLYDPIAQLTKEQVNGK